MIPTFPKFKKIEITDKDEIENFTKNYPPYSNFDFTSLFCWDVTGKREVSMLNDNLIVRSTCDATGEPFLTFLGTNDVLITVKKLLSLAKKNRLKPLLRLIPEEAVSNLEGVKNLKIIEDRDNFDYIYSIKKLCEYPGSEYAQARNLINRFLRKYNKRYQIKTFNVDNSSDRSCLAKLWSDWAEIKEKYTEREDLAAVRLLMHASSFDLLNEMVFVDDKPVAFSINQIINGTYAITHFAKANYEYSGVYAFLLQVTAKELAKKNCKLLNYEEDMGLPGLRRAKSSYQPECFMKKYTIRKKMSFAQRISMLLYK